ncbi:MAG: CRISPR-associated endonuclease Cas1, partial [Thermoanaerobaculia bacterium]
MGMRDEHLPPFDRYSIELRLAKPVTFPFEHGGVLRGLLSRALGQHRFPAGLIPFPCESGRVRYEAGEPYALGVTFAGPDRTYADRLIAGLERLGAARPRGPAPVLGGNFVVERAERLEPPDLDADVEALRRTPRIELRFVSPLRLERPPDLKRRGAGFFDRDCFPAAFFLDRLWRHLYHLTHQRYCDDEERARLQPALPEAGAATADGLLWSDLPVRGNQKRKPFTLGGVRGLVTLTGVTMATDDDAGGAWLEALVAGSYLHAGTKTGYGFGRYTLAGTSSASDPLLRPARTLLDRVAEPATDGEAAERAMAERLEPAIDTWIEEASYAYRRGYSRQGAARALERAYADGYRYVLDADLRAFFGHLDRTLLFARLEALYPFESLAELARGLRRDSPLTPVLAKLCLDTIDDEILDERFRLARFADDFAVLTKDPDAARAAKAHEAGSWLAEVPLERIEALLRGRREDGKGAAGFERVPLAHAAALDAGRWPLYVTTPDTRIYLRRGTVVLEPKPGEECRMPVAAISHAVFIGRVRATVPVLLSLAREGVPSYFCHPSGELQATFAPHHSDWPLWMDQARAAGDERLRLSFASAVVAARLRNLAAISVRLGWDGAAEAAAEMRSLARETVNKDTLDSLRGLEGRGTALFWAALA